MSKTTCGAPTCACVALAMLSFAVPLSAAAPGKPAVPAARASNDADALCQFDDKKIDTQPRKPDWCRGWFCRSGDPHPRKICYDFTTGTITSSNAEGPAAPIAPNTPVTVKVTGVNFYRINGKIAIQQDSFGDLFKIPDLISQNVLGTAKPQSTEKSDAKKLAQAPAPAKAEQAIAELQHQLSAKENAQKAAPKGKKLLSRSPQQMEESKKLMLQDIATDPKNDQAIRESAHQVLTIARSQQESLDQALQSYRQQVEAANASWDAKKKFGELLVAFNNATEELDDVEGLGASVQHFALTTDDLSKLREECQTTVATAFRRSAEAGIVSPGELPTLRAQVRFKAEEAFGRVQGAFRDLKPENDKEISDLFDKASARHDTLVMGRAERDKNFETFLVVYSKINDPSFGQKTSLPVASSGDDVEIRFDDCLTADAAKAAETEACDSSKATTILLIPVVGQRKPSFSTGIFFTGLDDPKYFKRADDTVQANAADRFSPVLGALIHTPLVFFRGPNLSTPLSFGVGLKDNNPVYLLGLSFIVGRSERSVFTLGIAGGQVTRLSGTALGEKITADQPPTEKVFRTRPMIGFTYNFTRQ
jgi:hypothetical protein